MISILISQKAIYKKRGFGTIETKSSLEDFLEKK